MNMPADSVLKEVTLDDKYRLLEGSVYLTGTQALVRLPMLQHLRDKRLGKNTAGYISGYRGSPLGGFDQALYKIAPLLEEHQIKFQPGLNEDLAATALWGTQQIHLQPGAKVDGVFGMWYGKGPGVDRCGDVFRHANQAGTAPLGGILALAGDDPGAKSSTMAAQTDYIFQAVSMPVFAPAGVQDYLDLGLLGWAASRYSGLWVGFKCVTDTIESASTVEISPDRPRIILPEDFHMPAAGVGIRWPEEPFIVMEERLSRYKHPAILAFARANTLDYCAWPSRVSGSLQQSNPSFGQRSTNNGGARFGIVSSGKAYLDTMQALADLGISADVAQALGLAVYKVSMPYPLEPQGIREFCKGLQQVLVVEEKRPLIEGQLKEILYGTANAPRVLGKRDHQEHALLPDFGELSPAMLARVIVKVFETALSTHAVWPRVQARLAELDSRAPANTKIETIARIPYFCSGCPHSTSTKVPEGSRAMAGIGCHYMAQWMDRSTDTFTHMGGEGMTWVGQAPFVETAHVFQNIGDGTYWHSGSLAIRHAVASKTRMTYKILFNDAVAMTGGQRHDGQLTPQLIAQQMAAEGAAKVVVVTDEPEKYPSGYFDSEVSVFHRDSLDQVQRDLRELDGVTVLIYDQTCASEKRRRRKRGSLQDPPKRAYINELVCEGCGDCGQASNCVSVEPIETEFGRKRAINQSSCNKDFSCVKGFCPSFVTVHGGNLRKGKGLASNANAAAMDPGAQIALPEPKRPLIDGSYALMVTGIGGTGVITIGQLLGMAAHLENKQVSVLDMAGLAQKGGAVISFIRFALSTEHLNAPRIAQRSADALIGCDLVTSASNETLDKLRIGKTRAVVNVARIPTGDFTKNPDWKFPQAGMEAAVAQLCDADNLHFVQATSLATALIGDAIASNLFMLGFAYQKGLVPVSARAIERAIELNQTAIEQNRRAFIWGRRAAVDMDAVSGMAFPAQTGPSSSLSQDKQEQSLEQLIATRAEFLTAYQNANYAQEYRQKIAALRDREISAGLDDSVSGAAARYLFKLMAIKDEYEVARLYTDGQFAAKLAEKFEGDFQVRMHLAPPLFAKKNAKGELIKAEYGPWMLSAMAWLAKGKRLRGTWFDFFGKTQERKDERAVLAMYQEVLAHISTSLTAEKQALALRLVQWPEQIRGFGHVRARHLAQAKPAWDQALAAYQGSAQESVVSVVQLSRKQGNEQNSKEKSALNT